jgi:hypothetical protein
MEFVFAEPLASADIVLLLRSCNQEEVDHLEHGALSLLECIRNLDSTEWPVEGQTLNVE